MKVFPLAVNFYGSYL